METTLSTMAILDEGIVEVSCFEHNNYAFFRSSKINSIALTRETQKEINSPNLNA